MNLGRCFRICDSPDVAVIKDEAKLEWINGLRCGMEEWDLGIDVLDKHIFLLQWSKKLERLVDGIIEWMCSRNCVMHDASVGKEWLPL